MRSSARSAGRAVATSGTGGGGEERAARTHAAMLAGERKLFNVNTLDKTVLHDQLLSIMLETRTDGSTPSLREAGDGRMTRPLPLLLLQAPPRSPETAADELREELTGLLADFPATRLVVYPEYNTCGVSGDPEQRREAYEGLAEPLDGPRVTALRAIARDAGVWLLPGTVPERGDDGGLYNTAVVIDPAGGGGRQLPQDLPLAALRALQARRPLRGLRPAGRRARRPRHLLRHLVPRRSRASWPGWARRSSCSRRRRPPATAPRSSSWRVRPPSPTRPSS